MSIFIGGSASTLLAIEEAEIPCRFKSNLDYKFQIKLLTRTILKQVSIKFIVKLSDVLLRTLDFANPFKEVLLERQRF